jgi:hypothetical protein
MPSDKQTPQLAAALDKIVRSRAQMRRDYWLQAIMVLACVSFFHWLTGSGPYAGKAVYTCFGFLGILFLGGQYQLGRELVGVVEVLRTGPPQAESAAEDQQPG